MEVFVICDGSVFSCDFLLILAFYAFQSWDDSQKEQACSI